MRVKPDNHRTPTILHLKYLHLLSMVIHNWKTNICFFEMDSEQKISQVDLMDMCQEMRTHRAHMYVRVYVFVVHFL